ncbi:hypothetical protein HJC23_007865 [Cyclotella cryptica]|uniref:Uncharacterized protein n=1 Tax=Cyclotella cryptica TaxID=29204 RepID=A0ABD3R0W6_9STRA|eukprot:CCRYP_000198-RA/>CCRYP_000198-RA protein AED:0.33 eAED:0.33 QI:0/-1/0/1/-1/1/1/0/325
MHHAKPTNVSSKSQICIALALITSFALASLFNGTQSQQSKGLSASHGRRLLLSTDDPSQSTTALRPGKPVMATFFESVSGGCCGMTEEGHRNLVKAWERAWQSYGWQTKILTEADARKHPRFEELELKLVEADVNGYNQRCFWRWLAMSMETNVNGGWMSDYDFFPLRLTSLIGKELAALPGFKSYSVHVPTLLNGDYKSWNVITNLIIDTISKDLEVDFLSDMYVLEYIYNHHTEEELGITAWERLTYSGFPYKKDGDRISVDCSGAMANLGAHLSHHDTHLAVDNGIFPKVEGVTMGDLGSSMNKRAEAANIMLRQFREACFR